MDGTASFADLVHDVLDLIGECFVLPGMIIFLIQRHFLSYGDAFFFDSTQLPADFVKLEDRLLIG